MQTSFNPSMGTTADVHALPGVDAAGALANLGGNEALFVRTLHRFLAAEREFVARFSAARAAGDMDSARRMAHDLQSVSGTLGMGGLRQAALSLEQACCVDDISAIDACLHEVSVVIAPLLQDLQTWADARARNPGAQASRHAAGEGDPRDARIADELRARSQATDPDRSFRWH